MVTLLASFPNKKHRHVHRRLEPSCSHVHGNGQFRNSSKVRLTEKEAQLAPLRAQLAKARPGKLTPVTLLDDLMIWMGKVRRVTAQNMQNDKKIQRSKEIVYFLISVIAGRNPFSPSEPFL